MLGTSAQALRATSAPPRLHSVRGDPDSENQPAARWCPEARVSENYGTRIRDATKRYTPKHDRSRLLDDSRCGDIDHPRLSRRTAPSKAVRAAQRAPEPPRRRNTRSATTSPGRQTRRGSAKAAESRGERGISAGDAGFKTPRPRRTIAPLKMRTFLSKTIRRQRRQL